MYENGETSVYHSFKRMTNNLLLPGSTFNDRVLTWCSYHSCEFQTCIISSHEKVEMKISSWRFYFILIRKVEFETICEYIKQLKLKFWSQMQIKCLNQL